MRATMRQGNVARSPDLARTTACGWNPREVQLSGNRIKASGSIVAAKSPTHPAFSASYDLVTDETGATKRLSLIVTMAERDRQLSVARDEENMWLITDHQGQSRGTYEGALDVDVIFSPFFNALPIRRSGLHRTVGAVTLPVVYVTLPELTVNPVSIRYNSHGPGEGIELTSPPPRPRSPSTITDSSSTTPDWQSESDDTAGPTRRCEFVTPVLLPDRNGHDLRARKLS